MLTKIKKTYARVLWCAHVCGITRVVWIACGCLFLVIGIIGWALPVMPGWPFALWGFSILMKNVLFVARVHAWCSRVIKRKWPRLYVHLVRGDAAYHRVLHALGVWLLHTLRRILSFLRIPQ